MTDAALPSLKRTLGKLALLIGPGVALVLLTFALPDVRLDSTLAVVAFWVAESGGAHGLPFVAVGLTVLLAIRPGVTMRRRVVDWFVITAIGVLALGGGAFANEHVLKPALLEPRPNIVQLAKRGVLGLRPLAFYALGDKQRRSKYLARRLRHVGFPLDARIRAHWIEETGYSFPSGHAFASWCTATLFVGAALLLCAGRYRWPFYLLVPWAVAVCTSRPLLRVHSPTDVSVGAVEGVLCGTLALIAARAVLVRLRPPAPPDRATAKPS